MENIELKFTLNREDLQEALTIRMPCKKEPILSRMALVFFWLVVFLVAMISVDVSSAYFSSPTRFPGYLGVTIGLGLFAIFVAIRHKKTMQNMVTLSEANSNVSGPVIATISARDIQFRSVHSVQRFDWAVVDDIHEHKNGIVLRRGAIVHNLPSRALPEGMQQEELLSKIRTWKEAP